jgi:hypothetical protein
VAIPSSMSLATVRTPSGVELQIHPSSDGGAFPVELRRSTQSSTASTAWFTHQLTPSSGAFRYIASLPLSTRTYYFQARHAATPGYSAGPYTAMVSAKPVKLSLGGSVPIVRGKNGAVEVPLGDVWLTSGKTVKVGTQATTGSIAKRYRVIACSFTPENSTMAYSHVTGKLQVTGTVTRLFMAPVPTQPGITFTRVRLHGKRGASASGICQVTLYRVSTAGSLTGLGTAVRLSSGMGSTESGTFSHAATTANGYLMLLQLKNGSTATTNTAQGVWAEAIYSMPTYDRTV